MKCNLIFLCLLITSLQSLKAQATLDSLMQVYNEEVASPAKLKTGLLIAKGPWKDKAELSERLGLEVLELAKAMKNDTFEFKALQVLGVQFARKDSVKAFDYSTRALRLARQLNEEHRIAETYNNRGIMFKNFGDFASAIRAYFKAIEINKKLDNTENLADNYQNIAAAFELSGKLNKALEYIDLGLALDKSKIRNDQISRMFNSKAIVHCKQNDLDEGVAYFKKALEFAPENNYFEKSNTLNNLSLAYQMKQDFPQALKYNRRAQAIANEVNDSTLLIRTMLGSVNILRTDGKIKEAQQTIDQGKLLAKKFNSKKFQVSFLEEEQKLLEQSGQYEVALQNQKEIMALKNELTNEEVLRNIDEVERKYDSELKAQLLKEAQFELEGSQRSKRFLTLLILLLILSAGIGFIAVHAHQKLKSTLQNQEKKNLEQKISDLERQREIESLHALMSGQESERQRIAQDLHDGIGSLLSTAKIYTEEADITPSLQKAASIIDKAAVEVRRIAHNMMPSALQKLGLIESIKELVQEYDDTWDIHFRFHHFGNYNRLTVEKETVIYRILQELIANILKHSVAKEALIQIHSQENQMHITVEDDGVGFEVDASLRKCGLGLRSITSRVSYLRGTVHFDSRPLEGTAVEIMIPV